MSKKICVTTDTVYSKKQIEKILTHLGINGVNELFVSSEYNVSKLSGLFEKVKEEFPDANILHIGDDISADVEAAERCGLNAFKIYSPGQLLEATGGLNLLNNVRSLSDRIRLGMFTATIFNDPFLFENEKSKLKIDKAYNVGFLCCAPIIMDFVNWFDDYVTSNNIKNVLLSARDGYLLEKLFKLKKDNSYKYFLTSRVAAIRAGTKTEKDVVYVDGMKFSGSLEDCVRVRYGIDRINPEDLDDTKEGLLKYAKVLIEKAKEYRHNYLKYIDTLELDDGKTVLFDFVAKGTTQLFLENVMENEIFGLYFLQLEPEFMKDKNLKIQAFYSQADGNCAIYDMFYLLETILTSPMASLECFDESGNPVYSRENRKKEDIQCALEIQEGIIDYVTEYNSLCPSPLQNINKKLDEELLGLLSKVEISAKDFKKMVIDDPFFNRFTSVEDVL